MSDGVRFEIIGEAEVTTALENLKDADRSLLEVVTRMTIELQRYVKDKKLNRSGGGRGGVSEAGQQLAVRTGRLRRSITQRVTDGGQTITGIVGTNVEYARAHEFGFQGAVTVKEHLRRVTQAWGRPLKTPVMATVREHTMQMNLPARSFLRSSLREMTPEIQKAILQSIDDRIYGRRS